jgi:hypothetical protein
MRDTRPEIERRYRAMLLARFGGERLKIGCSMHATAQALVRASVLASDPRALSAELRCALFLRFYGQEFATDERERIMAWLGRERNGVPEVGAAGSRDLGVGGRPSSMAA